MTRIVIVPGIGGSGPEHWQTRWEATLPAAVRIRPASWDEPRLVDWLRAIDDTAPGRDTVFVAHSMGCLAVAEWLTRHPRGAAGAFLVAPPDPAGPEYPDAAREFTVPRGTLGVPALVIASSDDPYAPGDAAERFARAWGAGLDVVGAFGHLNTASGLGEWAEGRERFDAFASQVAAAAA
ncbi:alpha/beta hydrolase [Agromyces intestinalis]|uniref:Alpha/beta hydrolase n=1 Tax=Agromyces intestinalis TaxID=2592652 RepID=A0A5C1YK14_9MICO|nr:alpha/beta hydrolase [Agromyces intestinalis]QEO15519.1 alpha/beta hydrolase [Agromyces intestinalis]